MSSDERAIRVRTWMWRAFKWWAPQTFVTLGTISSLVWGVYGEKAVWAFWVAVVLLIAAVIAQLALQRPTYMKLSADYDQLKESTDAERENLKADSAAKANALGQAMQVLLRNLAEHCNADANNDRVSVYYFYDDRFVMLSRYSLHPDYKRAARKEYPTNQGAIGEAWSVGSAVITLPKTRANWERSLVSKYGYSRAEAQALRMHSTSIAARRVEVDHNAVGVIVFESTDEDTVTQQTLDFVDDSKIYAALAEMISSAAMHTPRGMQLSHPVTPPETRSGGGNWKPSKRPAIMVPLTEMATRTTTPF
ncbi:hypothetical protein [Microbacterium sp. NPDC058389]|uniref:hypothetical protein n=1 Tax=Microbacterium sp. NPDC058389 TaxID=3346475 RepID=UPI003650D8ED